MEHCRSCGAPIVWRETVNGKFIPCDPEEIDIVTVKEGSKITGINALGESVSGIRIGEYHGELVTGMAKVQISHFATCPNAKEWRKKKNG